MNRAEREFINKHPGKRKRINDLIARELKQFKKIGFPNYDLKTVAMHITKNIIVIFEE